MNKRVVVVGLDGIPWHVLDRLFEHGAMPTLKKLAKNSLKGILKSTIPPYTPQAWTSIASGVNPGKHGVFGFITFEKDCKTRLVTSYDVRYPRLHEMVALKGLKSVCVNLPFTYPIAKIKGAMVISDCFIPGVHFHPASLKEIAKSFRSHIPARHFENKNEHLDSFYNETVGRVDAVNTLMEELDWNLFFVMYPEPDRLFHHYYDDIINGEKAAIKTFAKLDESIKKASQLADLVLVVSDHGFSKFKYAVHINSFLDKLGLVSKAKTKAIKEIVDFEMPNHKTQRVMTPHWAYRILSLKSVKFVLKKIWKIYSGKELRAEFLYVDPIKSKAFMPCPSTFGIYIKEPNLVNFVVKELKKLDCIGNAWRREELYHGPYLNRAPNVMFLPNFNAGYYIGSTMASPKIVTGGPPYGHISEGIIIVYCHEVVPKWVGEIETTDIAPTILNYLGLPVPSDTDGRQIPGIPSKIKPKPYNYLNHWLLTKRISKIKPHLEHLRMELKSSFID